MVLLSFVPGGLRVCLVHAAQQAPELPLGRSIPRLQLQGPLEVPHRLPVFVGLNVDPGQVEMGEVPGVVAWRLNRLLEPGNRLFPAAQLDEIGPDVVVGIAEVRVDLNRPFAFGDRLAVSTLETVGPAQKGVSFGRGSERDGPPVQADGVLELSRHLGLVGPAEELLGGLTHGRVPARSRAESARPPLSGARDSPRGSGTRSETHRDSAAGPRRRGPSGSRPSPPTPWYGRRRPG